MYHKLALATMKTKEEIEQLAQLTYPKDSDIDEYCGFIKGYNQCQEDMAELLKAEIRRAYIHGQGNAQGMAAGLERDEVEDYTNWRMLSLTKNN